MELINAKLKNLRKNRKLKQADLAKEFHVTKTTISKAENSTIPSDNLLKKYSDFFNIPFSDLFKLKENSKANHKLNNIMKDADKIITNADMDVQLDYLNHQDIPIPHLTFRNYALLEIPYFNNLYNYIHNKKHNTVEFILKKNEYFNSDNLIAIRINDESMTRVMVDQSIAIIAKDIEPQNGDIIAFSLENNQVGFRRLIDYPTYIRLKPESYDHMFQDITLMKDDFQQKKFHIIGKVIKVISDDTTLKY